MLVEPFCGIRYDTSQVSLEGVICGPYDVISTEQRSELMQGSPYNAVVLDKPEQSLPGYGWTREMLHRWLSDKILKKDGEPTFTVTEERFRYRGKEGVRRSFWAAVGLSPFGQGPIYPHENTYHNSVEDRRQLLYASRINTSPVFGLLSGVSPRVEDELARICSKPPSVEVWYQGVEISVYVTSPEAFSPEFMQEVKEGKVTIADGHHRYDAALQVYEEAKALRYSTFSPDLAGYVLMALTTADSPGLVIQPTHRWLKAPSEAEYAELIESMKLTHEFHQLESTDPSQWELYLESEKGSGVFGLVLREKDDVSAYLARPRDPDRFQQKVRVQYAGHSKDYCDLDVVTVDSFVSRAGVSWEPERNPEELVGRVRENGLSVGCFVRPVTPEIVRRLALSGETTPPKTTFFYPKQLTGIVFRSFSS